MYLSTISRKNKMADMLSDPTLHTEHAAIRHDVGLAEANIRDKVGAAACSLEQSIGATKFAVATEAAALSKQIGAEACGINTNIGTARAENERGFADARYNVAEQAHSLRAAIGDTRQEQAENFGHTRRDIMAAEGTIRREVAQEVHSLSRQMGDGFCNTDTKILETGSNIRREGSEHTNEIIKEGLKGDFNTRGDIKDTRYDLAAKMGAETDRIVAHTESGFDRTVDRLSEFRDQVNDRFYGVGRDLMDLRQGQATLAKDVELNALKTQLDAKQNTQYLSDKITADGEKTRGLINDLKYHDLNRGLVERNTALVNCEQDRRHYHDRYHDGRFDMLQAGFQGQWAQLQSQIQAFQSQLQETRQGMVNFGTMAGVGQSSTSNNVR